jgi:hypothetical protein
MLKLQIDRVKDPVMVMTLRTKQKMPLPFMVKEKFTNKLW